MAVALSQGANASLPTARIAVEVAGPVRLDVLTRHRSGEWEMTALGEYADAKTVKGMVVPAANLL